MRSALFASERLAASSCHTRCGISCVFTGRQSSRCSLFLLDLAPAARPVVGNDLPEHFAESTCVDLLVLTDRDGSGGLVVVAAGDDALRIRNDRAVVKEDVHMIFGGEQCADVALQYEIGLDSPLDRFHDLRVDGMNKIANLLTNLLLPRG